MHKTYRWINGVEHVYCVLRFYSQPSGLRGLVSGVEQPMWIDTRAFKHGHTSH